MPGQLLRDHVGPRPRMRPRDHHRVPSFFGRTVQAGNAVELLQFGISSICHADESKGRRSWI
eukprot:37901-Eustigmatos_ZCMA.PRE.1